MTIRPYFFDANAIAKLVINERGSKAVQALCERPEVVHTTWLSLAEVYGIIKRRWRKEKWRDDQYYRKLYDLQRNIQQRITIDGPVNLPLPEFRKLKRIHDTYRLDFSDALHLVLLQGVVPVSARDNGARMRLRSSLIAILQRREGFYAEAPS